MVVSFVAQASVDAGTASQSGLSVTMPSAAAALDVAIMHVVTERGSGVLPSVPSGWTVLHSASYSANDLSQTLAWKRLTASDLGATISTTVTTGRRMAMSLAVFRGAANPAFSGPVYDGGGASTDNVTTPSVTPASADSMLVGILAAVVVVSPYVRTFTVASPYTMRSTDSTTATASTNPTTAIASRLLSGGAGASQAGATFTASDPSFHSWNSTIVLAPGGPSGVAPDPQDDIEPGTLVTLAPTGTGTWAQTSGTPVTLAGSGTTKTFEAPYTIAGTTLGFTFGGDPTSVTVLPATERAAVGGVAVPVKLYVAS